MEYWFYACEASFYVFTNNGKQVAAKLFDSVRETLRCKHFFTTAYHPQIKKQTERLNMTIVQQLRYYVADHEMHWGQNLQPLVYSYNMKAHRKAEITPFDLVLMRHSSSTTSA